MGGHIFGGLHSFGLVVAAVLVVYLVYRCFFKSKPLHHILDRRDSLEILKTRLASGEISTEEYDKLKNILLS